MILLKGNMKLASTVKLPVMTTFGSNSPRDDAFGTKGPNSQFHRTSYWFVTKLHTFKATGLQMKFITSRDAHHSWFVAFKVAPPPPPVWLYWF